MTGPAVPKHAVLIAALCGALATVVVNLAGITLLYDEGPVIIVSVVAGVMVMLGVAYLIDEVTRRR